MSFRRYQTYRPTTIQWLPEVPAHWKVTAVKRLCKLITDGAHISPETDGGEYFFVSTADLDGSNIDFEGCLKTSAKSYEYLVRTGCRPQMGDVLFSKDGTIGRTLVVEEDREFVVASSLIIIRPDQVRLDSDYLNYLCQSDVVRHQVMSFVRGAGLPRLSIQNLLRVVGTFPPLEEQRAIAHFLRKEIAKVDALVEEQRRLIELLKEKLQAIIAHAVTKGLDRAAPRKDAGVEWLGEVPAHWELVRAKVLFQRSELPSPAEAEVVTCFRDGQVTLRRNRREDGFTFAVLEVGYQGIKPGQLVLHSMDAFAGAIGVCDSEGKCSPEYIVCDARTSDVVPDYYGKLLRLMALRGFVLAICPSVRERAPRIRFPEFGELLLPVPPRDEQVGIVNYIAHEVDKLGSLREAAERSMQVLADRRAALISAAVTGKFDVREPAAAPAELEPA